MLQFQKMLFIKDILHDDDSDEYEEDDRDTIDIECETDDLLNIIEGQGFYFYAFLFFC